MSPLPSRRRLNLADLRAALDQIDQRLDDVVGRAHELVAVHREYLASRGLLTDFALWQAQRAAAMGRARREPLPDVVVDLTPPMHPTSRDLAALEPPPSDPWQHLDAPRDRP